MDGRLLDFASDADRPAIRADEGSLSYGELEARSRLIAGRLSSLGLGAGDRFAFLLPNSADMLGCYIACARIGIVGVPISQRVTASELAFQLQDSAAVALVYVPRFEPLVAHDEDAFRSLRHCLRLDELLRSTEARGAAAPAALAEPALDLGAPFIVMYTGGTTGGPKAAIQTRRSWMCCLRSSVEEWELSEHDRHLIALPMSHAAWFTAGAALLAGGTVTIMDGWDPDRALDLIAAHRITTLNMIPTMLTDLIRACEARPRDVGSVRLLTVAGSVLPIATYRRACALFGEVVGNIYGLTEAAGPVTFLNPSDMRAGKLDSVGRPGRFVELAILDERGRPIAGPEPGEIGLAGPQITPGYLNRDRESREAFSGRWFLTGDVGRLDADGFLHIVDRRKDMIKTGGFNVYPSEVEQFLYRQPEVHECAVLGVPDARWSEAVHAVVVFKPGRDSSAAELIARCRQALASYKVPKVIHRSSGLPRTRFGKFDKSRLRQEIIAEADSSGAALSS